MNIIKVYMEKCRELKKINYVYSELGHLKIETKINTVLYTYIIYVLNVYFVSIELIHL